MIIMKRKLFLNIYWKLQSFIAPNLRYSQNIFEDILTKYCNPGNVWLDVGCGRQLLSSWRYQQEIELVSMTKSIVGIDYDYWSLTKHKTIKNRVRGDITKLPFPNDSFDLITSNMVFEHLDNPADQLIEISRVLKPEGKLIFHTPNTLGYSTIIAKVIPEAIKDKIIGLLSGRKEEDVFPAFYRINSPSRITKLAKESGLKIVKISMICSSALLVIFPPIVFFELLWIRLLMTGIMKPFRTNIIAILEKA